MPECKSSRERYNTCWKNIFPCRIQLRREKRDHRWGIVLRQPIYEQDRVDPVDPSATLKLGGGSTIGLGKAIALQTDLPQIVFPTTYAGSEMTPIVGETKNGLKTIRRSPRVMPETVIYDVDLTLSLPIAMSVTSGINAMAHAIEALYAQDRNPVISLMAADGIRALMTALPRIATNPVDHDGRSDALYGAWLSGACLGAVSMALHHKLCHTSGGSFIVRLVEYRLGQLDYAICAALQLKITPTLVARSVADIERLLLAVVHAQAR